MSAVIVDAPGQWGVWKDGTRLRPYVVGWWRPYRPQTSRCFTEAGARRLLARKRRRWQTWERVA